MLPRFLPEGLSSGEWVMTTKQRIAFDFDKCRVVDPKDYVERQVEKQFSWGADVDTAASPEHEDAERQG